MSSIAPLNCPQCDAAIALADGEQATCGHCGESGLMQPKPLGNNGSLYVYSIVHRSFPGVAVPYVSAIVDLDGGGTVKGNLINIDPDPEKIRMGMPVEVVYQIAPTKDADGNEYLTYYFQPAA